MNTSELGEDVVMFEVKKILKSKSVDGKKYYFVKWKNWPDDFNTWEEESTLAPAAPLLNQFNNKTTDILEEKQTLKKMQEYDKSYGNFKYGDVPLKIKSVEIDQNNPKLLNCLVEWKERLSGEKPKDSLYSNTALAKKAPLILIDFYEARIKIFRDN